MVYKNNNYKNIGLKSCFLQICKICFRLPSCLLGTASAVPIVSCVFKILMFYVMSCHACVFDNKPLFLNCCASQQDSLASQLRLSIFFLFVSHVSSRLLTFIRTRKGHDHTTTRAIERVSMTQIFCAFKQCVQANR